MCRCFTIATGVLVLLSGCANPKMSMEMPKKPTPGPEMAKLAVLLGEWEGTANMVEPSPEEMKAFMPEGEEMPSSFAGVTNYTWALDGMYLKGEGWHEMGDGQRMNYVEGSIFPGDLIISEITSPISGLFGQSELLFSRSDKSFGRSSEVTVSFK